MCNSNDFVPILRSFAFVGLVFNRRNRKQESKILGKILKLILEITFLAYPVYLLILTLCFQHYPPNLILTTICTQVTLIVLRIVIFSRKDSIIKVTNSLSHFLRGTCTVPSLKKYAVKSCFICFGVPLIMSINILILTFNDVNVENELLHQYFLNQTITDNVVVLIGIVSVGQVLYFLHCIVFPSLALNLLIFLYLKYVTSTRKCLSKIQNKLQTGFTTESMKFLPVLKDIAQMHYSVENATSLIAFVSYIMTFVNFVSLIPLLSTGFMSEFEIIKYTISVYLFVWTTFWFAVVTFCGSETTRIRKDMQAFVENVIFNCTSKACMQNRESLTVLLITECTYFDLPFTGWEMFQVDKKLILNTVGVIVTYGVLFFNT